MGYQLQERKCCMIHTSEEQHLLEKLASGTLDGMVGDEREYRSYHSTICGKLIRNGIPTAYRQSQPTGFFTGQGSEGNPDDRAEETFDTDEQKLEFLRRYGWLMNDQEVQAYSARYKPGRKEGR